MKNALPTGQVFFHIARDADGLCSLLASHTLADANGIGGVSWQWFIDGNAVAGATGSRLAWTPVLVGHEISVAVAYTDGQGHSEAVSSSPGWIIPSAVADQAATWLSFRQFRANGVQYIQDNPLCVQQTAQADFNGDGLDDVLTYDSYPLDISPTPNPPPSLFIQSSGLLNKVPWTRPDLRSAHGTKVMIGDFNGDGWADVFSLVAVDPPFGAFPDLQDFNHLLFNSASGFRIAKEFDDLRGFWYAGATGDIDNDGDLDVVMFNFHVGVNHVANRLLWNDGTGNFVYSTDGIGTLPIVDEAELHDVNHDGFLDLVADRIDTSSGRQPITHVMWGDGTGFNLDRSASVQLPRDLYAGSIGFWDLDKDGVDEIFVSGPNDIAEYRLFVYRSKDQGKTFSDETAGLVDNNLTRTRFDQLRVTDVDSDGLPDLVGIDREAQVRWEWNGVRFIAQTRDAVAPVPEGNVLSTGTSLVLRMSEAVIAGSGDITLKDSTGTVIESFLPLQSGPVKFMGDALAITPSSPLVAGDILSLEFSAGAVTDFADNPVVAFSRSFQVVPEPVAVPGLPSQYQVVSGVAAGGPSLPAVMGADVLSFGDRLGTSFVNRWSLADLSDPDGAGPLTTPARTLVNQICDLYVAYFGRAPDVQGLLYWLREVASGNWQLEQVASSFTDQAEYRSRFPAGTSDRDFVRDIYQNLFDRSPDAAGWDYWVGDLGRGLPRDSFILTVIRGAYASTGSAVDRLRLDHKHEVARYYTEQLALHPLEAFDAAIDLVLSRVDGSAASVANAEHLIDHIMVSPLTVTGLRQDSALWDSFWG